MISVVMASYLGKYNGAAKDRETKFIRAVDSFLSQTNEDSELVIVSDGCDITTALTPKHHRIQLLKIPKQKIWSPVVRNTGIHYANGAHVCYLDTDDMLGPTHLQTIANNLDPTAKWGCFNDFVWSHRNWTEREVDPGVKFRCGTSNVVHKAGIYWPELASDYLHDWTYISSLRLLGDPQRLPTPQYFVGHIPKRYDV